MSGGTERFVDSKIANRRVILWTKRGLSSCIRVQKILESYSLPADEYEVYEFGSRHDCPQIETYFLVICLASKREVPRLFIEGRYIGSELDIVRLHEAGELLPILTSSNPPG